MRHSALHRNWAAALTLLAVLALAPQAGFSAVPESINYQGSLSDSLGDPVNGAVDMTFSLYSDSGGVTQLWTETQTGVTVTNGMFNVTLGAVVPLNLSDFDNPVWLGVAVGADPEMTPLQAITSVGYALRAKGAEAAVLAVVSLDLNCTACVAGTELDFDPATQAELDTHGAAMAAHHARYTDAEAITAVGAHTTSLDWASLTSVPAGLGDGDDDTLGGVPGCTSGQVAKSDGAGGWSCQDDTDTNTQRTEGEVETFVTNGALDLNAGTTLGGAAIQTGADAVGVTGVNVVTGVTLITAGLSDTATASCAVGEVVLGGGWLGAATTVIVQNSYPDTGAPQGWTVDAQNTDVSNLNVTAYAICATP